MSATAPDNRRFKLIPVEELTPEQKKVADNIRSGPRSAVKNSSAAKPGPLGGPFNVWLRSPGVGDIIQSLGAEIRFRSSLPTKLNELAIMVDANQGWRMPGDIAPRWSPKSVLDLARELDRLDVYWLEEPLPSDDADGYAELRRATKLRLAGGEMARTAAEARALVLRGGIDVLQTDVVLAGGIEGARAAAGLVDENGATWSPHTW